MAKTMVVMMNMMDDEDFSDHVCLLRYLAGWWSERDRKSHVILTDLIACFACEDENLKRREEKR